MDSIRERFEKLEYINLSKKAAHVAETKGRITYSEKCPVRTEYQRDRDRIIHSKSFRRLKQKTQVFLDPEGDHYRTRLTHTLEVSQIARTIARALALNEDLTEAIALGHDLGHTPFGHAGERVLDSLYEKGFRHNEQSLRMVDMIENDGKGLNLTYEVRNGILCHVGDVLPETLEGKIIRYADRIAYLNHDFDDAVRAGILSADSIPPDITKILGDSKNDRINTAVLDIVDYNAECLDIMLSPAKEKAMDALNEFMFEKVYRNPTAKGQEGKAQELLAMLYKHFIGNSHEIPSEYKAIIESEGIERAVCDYIACMTDRYAIDIFKNIFVPEKWNVV